MKNFVLLMLLSFIFASQAFAAEPYACRPVSRIGAQSIEGPLTLTCTSCTDAIVLPSGKKLSFAAGETANLYRSSANTLKTDGVFISQGNLYAANNILVTGSIYNDGAGYGGSLAFNDPTRWLSTTTALLESSTTATAGADTAFTLNSINSLAAADKLLSVQNGTSESFSVYASGAVVANGNITASDAYVWAVQARQAGNSIIVRGNISDGGTAIANKIGNVNALSTAGAKILSLYSDNLTTERAYVSFAGAIRPGTAIAAAPAQPYACTTSHEGELIYRRDTDVGATYGGMCACACTGEATPTCAWQTMAGAACF